MTSEAQKRATAKYEAAKVKTQTVKFFPDDYDLYDHMKSQPRIMDYIRGLIRADVEGRVVPKSDADWQRGLLMSVETYTAEGGSNMDRIEYKRGNTVESIARDLVDTVKGWDYAFVTADDIDVCTIVREGDGWCIDWQ